MGGGKKKKGFRVVRSSEIFYYQPVRCGKSNLSIRTTSHTNEFQPGRSTATGSALKSAVVRLLGQCRRKHTYVSSASRLHTGPEGRIPRVSTPEVSHGISLIAHAIKAFHTTQSHHDRSRSIETWHLIFQTKTRLQGRGLSPQKDDRQGSR